MDILQEETDTCHVVTCTSKATETVYWTTKNLSINYIKIQTCKQDKENITNVLEYIILVIKAAREVTGFDVEKELDKMKLQELKHPKLRIIQDYLYNINNGFVDLKLMVKQKIVNSTHYAQLLNNHDVIKRNMSTIYDML